MSVSFFHTMFVGARAQCDREPMALQNIPACQGSEKNARDAGSNLILNGSFPLFLQLMHRKTHEAAARRSGPRSAAKQRLSLCGPGRIPLGPSVPTPALRTARLGPRSEPSSALVNGQRCSPSQQALIIPCCFSGDFSLSMLDIETMQIESRSSRAQSYRIERPRLDN